jgi:DNA-binding transcriptional regulator YbjK
LASTTYWLSSKDEIVAAALELAADEVVARLRRIAESLDPVSDPVEAVIVLLLTPVGEQLRTSRASPIAAYALWLEAAGRAGLRELSLRWTDAYRAAVAAVLERAGSEHLRSDARVLIATADGQLMEQLVRGSLSALRPALRALAAMLIGRGATR